MRRIFYLAAMSLVLVMSGCRLKNAADDLSDALEDATKTEGPEACYDIMEAVYQELDGLADCADAPVIGEGETAESLGMAWCDSNCSDLSEKVEYTDAANCSQALYSLECDDLKEFVDGIGFPDSCNWLDNDLGC